MLVRSEKGVGESGRALSCFFCLGWPRPWHLCLQAWDKDKAALVWRFRQPSNASLTQTNKATKPQTTQATNKKPLRRCPVQ